MGHVHKPEGDRPRDEGVIVPPIQDKQEKEGYSKESYDKSRRVLFASFFSYLKNLLQTVTSKEKMQGEWIEYVHLLQDLKAFRHFLEMIGKNDVSEQLQFANNFSVQWHLILKQSHQIELLERKHQEDSAIFGIKRFILSIRDYPEGEQHSLGYYLDKNVGIEWLPFPYIEIIKKLHTDYQTNRTTSALHQWLDILDRLIGDLESKLGFKP